MESIFYLATILIFLFASFFFVIRGMSNYNKNNS